MSRPRVLAFAYMIDPGRGSEPGAGWAFIRILAGFADVTVITRNPPPDGSGTFAAWEGAIPESGKVRFVSVQLPGDPAFAGADMSPSWWSRQPYLGYFAWQIRAARIARDLHARTPFDLTWHVTWANGWLGSTLSMIDAPFVLGPIGGGVGPPWRLVTSLGLRAIVYEGLRMVVRTAGRRVNPLARRSWSQARLVLAQNQETVDWLPASIRSRTRIFHNATIVDQLDRVRAYRSDRRPTALFAGRLTAWKGCHLAVQAIAGLPDWRLVICGDGRDLPAIEALVAALGIEDRVELRGWQTHEEVLRMMAEEADALLFPSLHDEAGLAVAEAAAIGLPIVCLDVGGPPLIAGGGVKAGDERTTVAGLRGALLAALHSTPEPSRLDPATRRSELLDLLDEAGLLRVRPETDLVPTSVTTGLAPRDAARTLP